MYPDDYISSYEIVEESDTKVKIRCKITPQYCRPCDHASPHRNGPKSKTIYDIDSRTGKIVEIEVIHYQYRCTHRGCSSTFVLDTLPTKCFPNEHTEGRSNKSKSRDILNAAMDYLLLGSDDKGNPVTAKDAAKKYGYDRKVITTELHARVNATMSEHILSNEVCAQAALVPFMYRGIMRCAVMGYVQREPDEPFTPVLYDLRDSYNPNDLLAYLREYRYQELIVPEVTYLDMDEAFIDLVYKLYVEDYQCPHESFYTGIVKSLVKDRIRAIEPTNLENQFGFKETFDFFKRRLGALLYDKDLSEGDDDTEDTLIDSYFASDETDFYTILDTWMEEITPDIVAKEFEPLYELLYQYADSIDVSMTRYREDGVCPEDELGFIKHFHKRNLDFAEMRYRVHCLSKNKQNISFQQLIQGQYKPSVSGKSLQRYYIDLNELNALFQE